MTMTTAAITLLTAPERNRWEELLAEKESLEGDLERVANCQKDLLQRLFTRALLQADWQIEDKVLRPVDSIVSDLLCHFLTEALGPACATGPWAILREESGDQCLYVVSDKEGEGVGVDPHAFHTGENLPNIDIYVRVDLRQWAATQTVRPALTEN